MRAYIYCAHKASRNEQVSQHVATDSCQSCWMQDAGWLMIIPSLPSTNWRTCWTLHRCPKHQPSSFFFTWHFESVFSRIQICCQTRHQNCVAVSGVDAVRGGAAGPQKSCIWRKTAARRFLCAKCAWKGGVVRAKPATCWWDSGCHNDQQCGKMDILWWFPLISIYNWNPHYQS